MTANSGFFPVAAAPHLVRIKSRDGGNYDLYAIVPAHISPRTVGDKINAHLDVLRQKEQESDDGDQNYSDEDIGEFVESLGCVFSSSPTVTNAWD